MLDQSVALLFSILTAVADATPLHSQTASSVASLLQSDFAAAGTTAVKEDTAASHLAATGSLYLLLFAFAVVLVIGLWHTRHAAPAA